MNAAIDLRSLRERHQLSQAALADRLGIHQGTVSRWERGGLPTHGLAKVALFSLFPELNKLSDDEDSE